MLILNQREVNMGCFRFRRLSPGIQPYDFSGRFAKGRYANPTCPKISRAKPSRVNYTACLICVYKINWYDFAREKECSNIFENNFFPFIIIIFHNPWLKNKSTQKNLLNLNINFFELIRTDQKCSSNLSMPIFFDDSWGQENIRITAFFNGGFVFEIYINFWKFEKFKLLILQRKLVMKTFKKVFFCNK